MFFDDTPKPPGHFFEVLGRWEDPGRILEVSQTIQRWPESQSAQSFRRSPISDPLLDEMGEDIGQYATQAWLERIGQHPPYPLKFHVTADKYTGRVDVGAPWWFLELVEEAEKALKTPH